MLRWTSVSCFDDHGERIRSEWLLKNSFRLFQGNIDDVKFDEIFLFWWSNSKKVRVKIEDIEVAYVCVILAEQMKIKTVCNKDRKKKGKNLFGWNLGLQTDVRPAHLEISLLSFG